MKQLIFILTILVWGLSGCSNMLKVEGEAVQENSDLMDSNFSIGKVHLNQDGCKIFIVTEGSKEEKLYPIGLDEMFQVDNAILQFEYDLSRAPLPEECGNCRAVVLRSITRVKR